MPSIPIWARARWLITTASGASITIETTGKLTWALRTIRVAPRGIVRPPEAGGAWARHIADLKGLGVPIVRLPARHGMPAGWRLAALSVEEINSGEAG
jgi:hypothetical protein